jgi:hypothetical protein
MQKNAIFIKRVPVADIGKRLLVCDIVHKKNAHGAPKVSGGDGAKPLRAGSVPNLQFAALVINFDSADLEIDANGSTSGCVKSVVRETEQQAALAHVTVSYYQQLDEAVISSDGVCSHERIQIYVERWSMDDVFGFQLDKSIH